MATLKAGDVVVAKIFLLELSRFGRISRSWQ